MAWPEVARRIEAAVFKEADRAALAMERKAVQLVPKGASEPGLDKSIHGKATREGFIIRARAVCQNQHGAYIEFGTGPAAGHAQYMPPKGVLRQWIRRVLGIGDEKAIDEAEAAIRWKIYHKGTRPQPFMKPAFDHVAKQWKGRLAAAVKEAIRG